VVSSYKTFFTSRATPDDDSRVDEWIAEPLSEVVEELTALMVQPLDKLQDFRLVTVPGPERRRRVLTVGRVMLQLLAIQYELKEPLNLNGDTFEDIMEGSIEWVPLESSEALRAMILATKPKVLNHVKYWDMATFSESATNFLVNHTAPDPAYRPATYRRSSLSPRESRRPAIAIDNTGEDRVRGKFPTKTRPRSDDDVDEDTPPPKRQATSRQLRSRKSKSSSEEQAAAVPVGKIVASGKGWYTIDVDNSGN